MHAIIAHGGAQYAVVVLFEIVGYLVSDMSHGCVLLHQKNDLKRKKQTSLLHSTMQVIYYVHLPAITTFPCGLQ